MVHLGRLESLHQPSQVFDLGSQVGQSWAVGSDLLQITMAKHKASETCLLMSHLRHLNYVISPHVKNHRQKACDLSLYLRLHGFGWVFFFLFLLYKNVSET